jgi:RimJ/RimL family protein N-acetyltransferase
VYGQNDRVREWATRTGGYHWSHLETTIGLERCGELVAAAGYTDYIAGASISGHIIIQGRINRDFMRAILWYPFEQLKVQRLSGIAPAKNLAVQHFMEHIGLTYETTLARMLPDDDIRVYRIFREEL